MEATMRIGSRDDLTAVVDRWSMRRSSPRFWPTMGWMHDERVRQSCRETGVPDLNRYQNL